MMSSALDFASSSSAGSTTGTDPTPTRASSCAVAERQTGSLEFGRSLRRPSPLPRASPSRVPRPLPMRTRERWLGPSGCKPSFAPKLPEICAAISFSRAFAASRACNETGRVGESTFATGYSFRLSSSKALARDLKRLKLDLSQRHVSRLRDGCELSPGATFMGFLQNIPLCYAGRAICAIASMYLAGGKL